MSDDSNYIMPAEFMGNAEYDADGYLCIGTADAEGNDVVKLRWRGGGSVFVRRYSRDLTICEIHLTQHSGLAEEENREQNRQAEIYPLGPMEYWRSHYVDGQSWTEEEFARMWE